MQLPWKDSKPIIRMRRWKNKYKETRILRKEGKFLSLIPNVSVYIKIKLPYGGRIGDQT
jgi:hypothetical protein